MIIDFRQIGSFFCYNQTHIDLQWQNETVPIIIQYENKDILNQEKNQSNCDSTEATLWPLNDEHVKKFVWIEINSGC